MTEAILMAALLFGAVLSAGGCVWTSLTDNRGAFAAWLGGFAAFALASGGWALWEIAGWFL